MMFTELLKKSNLLYRKHFYFTLILYFIITIFLRAQAIKENWTPVNNNSNKIYINTVGLENFKEDDIYVWVLEEHRQPIVMEGIDVKIYKTKTYFLLNKHLRRYSILQIIFYDSKNNVIKSYNYERNNDNPDFKYRSPILEGSDVSVVLLKCIEVIASKK